MGKGHDPFFFKTNLNSFYPRMLCVKFGWNWPSAQFWRRILNFVNIFSIFCYYLAPGKRVWPIFWSNWNPFHPRMPCTNLVEISQVVLEKEMKIKKCLWWQEWQTNIDRKRLHTIAFMQEINYGITDNLKTRGHSNAMT